MGAGTRSATVCAACIAMFCQTSVAQSEEAAPETPLEIAITTNLGAKVRLIEGDGVQFLVSLSRDAYVALYLDDAESRVYRIFPLGDASTGSHPLGAGSFLPLPDEQQHYSVRAPYGKETVWVIAATKALPRFSGNVDGSFVALEARMPELLDRLRAFRSRCACAISWSSISFTTAPSDLSWPD